MKTWIGNTLAETPSAKDEMRKTSPATIYGVAGLTMFGVAYDSGLFGTPDGHDHSAVVMIAPSTGMVATVYAHFTVTGDEVAIFQPIPAPLKYEI